MADSLPNETFPPLNYGHIDRNTISPTVVPQPGRRFVRPLLALSIGTVTIFGTVGPVSAAEITKVYRRLPEMGTHGPLLIDTDASSTLATGHFGDVIRLLRRDSGLTYGEISSALGVSRRAVHHWISGNRISPRHTTALQQLQALVAAQGQGPPNLIRQKLLAPGAAGISLLTAFEREQRPTRRIPLSSQPITSILEVDETEAAPPAEVRRASIKGRRVGQARSDNA